MITPTQSASASPGLPETPSDNQPVWDLPVRLFHWALVICLGGSVITAQLGGLEAMGAHAWFGLTALSLVLFRVVWGFVGNQHARFKDFTYGPLTVWRYSRGLFARKPSPYLGHNPLGGVSVLLMLALVLVQACTGLFADDDVFFEGPLNGWVSDATASRLTSIHKINVKILLAVIGLHIAAVLWYWVRKRQNLIWPMITGRKPGSGTVRSGAPLWVAALVLAGCAGAIALLVGSA